MTFALLQPSFVIPTVVANWDPLIKGGEGPLDDLDYSIGHEALSKAAASSLTYPVKHGMVRSQSSLAFILSKTCHQNRRRFLIAAAQLPSGN